MKTTFTDKSGIFKDFGFKLLVIDSLLKCETSFSKELKEMKIKYVDPYDDYHFNYIPEMVDYFQELVLTEEDLKKVESLTFDGGDDIYFYIFPNWDGESDEFDILSVEDYKLLPNLKKVIYTSMCDSSLMEVFKENGITVI